MNKLTDRMSSITSVSSMDSEESFSNQGIQRTISNFGDELNLAVPKKRIDIITPSVSYALDVANVSGRKATRILAATLVSAGLDLNDYNFSHSTIYRNRKKNRAEFAKQLKENLQVAESVVLQFDGKLLPDISGTEVVDRLPIVISGLNTDQLLGVPKIDKGTGAKQAQAIIDTIDDWGVTDKVKALCFDTTNTNTGKSTLR